MSDLEIAPEIVVFGGSLFAIMTIVLFARWLGLGGNPILDDEGSARVATEVEDGFEPNRISISRTKDAALIRDHAGRVMVIRRHGNRFVGRLLTRAACAREEVDALVVDPGPDETHFGKVRLRLVDAAAWADAINRL